jgi:hypothetical protein
MRCVIFVVSMLRPFSLAQGGSRSGGFVSVFQLNFIRSLASICTSSIWGIRYFFTVALIFVLDRFSDFRGGMAIFS